MAINWTEDLYKVCWDVFARPITVTPVVSQPGGSAYANRGYFDTKDIDVMAEDGSVFSDAQTYLDIRMAEFPVSPMQKDRIDIPFHAGTPGGSFEVSDLAGVGNAGGIITLTLKRIVAPLPAAPPPVGP
jgi:hypothetical protein